MRTEVVSLLFFLGVRIGRQFRWADYRGTCWWKVSGENDFPADKMATVRYISQLDLRPNESFTRFCSVQSERLPSFWP